MKGSFYWLLSAFVCTFILISCRPNNKSVTVPFTLDHNRMLIEAELQGNDGSWHKAKLWVDTGNPKFYMSESLARSLGIDLTNDVVNPDVPTPAGIRIGGMQLNFEGVKSKVMLEPFWLFSTMHNDGNLPSTVLKKYDVVFDYPKKELTLAEPGSIEHTGICVDAAVNSETGIIQIDAVIGGDNLSFALDNGAAYSFISGEVLDRIYNKNSDWPRITGALGCANMWGWWPPQEESAPVVRIPEMMWGPVRIAGAAIVGVPYVAPGGPSLGDWYSQKTARHVDGFLGPNVFKAFRIEIDYSNNAIYFEKGDEFDSHDMDIVGLTLRPIADGSYQVIGIAEKDGKPAVESIEPGDILLQVGDLKTTGETMGTVVDALRGKPGDICTLILKRDEKQFTIQATVERFL
ncbi:MAG: hypothetical protein A2V66_17755 [Ignavibacteria bacterium RBG_13_36_8]|nr:MAG: hypothetical protein A2V66_17755 [Ignavibacteria bacterium RBG_13_36_8]